MKFLLKKILFNLIVFVICICVKLIKFYKNYNLNFLKLILFKKKLILKLLVKEGKMKYFK